MLPETSVCPETRSCAPLRKMTREPSSLIATFLTGALLALAPPAGPSPERWLARKICPFDRWKTKASLALLVSFCPATRLLARLRKARRPPSALSITPCERLLPAVVAEPAVWLTRVRVPVERSHRKRSGSALVSVTPGITAFEVVLKASQLPSALSAGKRAPTAVVASGPWLTRVIPPVARAPTDRLGAVVGAGW